MVPGWFKSETLSTPLICMLAPQSRFGLVMMMIDDGNGGQGLSHQFSFVHKQKMSHRPTSTDGEIKLGLKRKQFAELFSRHCKGIYWQTFKVSKESDQQLSNATKSQFFPIAVNHRWCLVVLAQIITFAKHPPILIFHKLSLLLLILTTCNTLFLFSCLGQLNRWPCQWLSQSVSHFWF